MPAEFLFGWHLMQMMECIHSNFPRDYDGLYVIIPCFNESYDVLCDVLQRLKETLPKCHIVVVDDGSAIPVQLDDCSVVVLRHIVNRGQGAALQTGMDYAVAQSNMRYIAHFDADGQHRPDDIRNFLQRLENGDIDIVLGSRFLEKCDSKSVPLPRRLLLIGGRVINHLFTGVWLTDAHNGLRSMSRHAAECIKLREDRMAHASEILQQIHQSQLRYMEMPCHIEYSEYSRKKGQGALNALNILFDLIVERLF